MNSPAAPRTNALLLYQLITDALHTPSSVCDGIGSLPLSATSVGGCHTEQQQQHISWLFIYLLGMMRSESCQHVQLFKDIYACTQLFSTVFYCRSERIEKRESFNSEFEF